MIGTHYRIDFFDYLRALAVTLVVMTHYISPIVPGGSIGVSIFFCLSGYLIVTILLKEREMTSLKAVAFIVRRFMRVFPAYLGAILFMLALMKITRSPKLPALIAALPGLLTFTKMPESIGMETGVFWTLYVEFWFYVTMPFLMLFFGSGRRLIAAIIFLIGLSVFFKLCPIFNIPLPNLGPISSLIFWMDNLLYGSVVAIFAFRHKINISFAIVPTLMAGALIGLVTLALVISSEDRLIAWPFMSLAASLLTALILSAFTSTEKRELHIFSRAWIGLSVAWLGRISYSIYLYHAIPLDYHAMVPKAIIVALPLIIVAVAATSYYLVEKPGIALGRELARRVRQ